jgi:putative DNA methylase
LPTAGAKRGDFVDRDGVPILWRHNGGTYRDFKVNCRSWQVRLEGVSWGRMRREVMADVRQLQAMLENHAKEGLPAADIQVIRRGKALEYFSRHYGRVYVDAGRAISVKDALVGINQLIDEDADKGKEPPPVNAEPITRQFLRTFGTAIEIKRDQLQKFLKGSITTPDEFDPPRALQARCEAGLDGRADTA